MKELDAKALHEVLEGEVKSEVMEEKEQSKGIKDSVKIEKKRKGKGERYSRDIVDRAFMKLKK